LHNDSFFVSLFQDKTLFLNPENKDKVMQAYREELSRLINQGFTEEEFNNGKQAYLQYYTNRRSEDGESASLLNNYVFLGRDMQFEAHMEERIANAQLEDVNAAMQRNWNVDKVSIVSVGDFK
jgi:zinc protease